MNQKDLEEPPLPFEDLQEPQESRESQGQSQDQSRSQSQDQSQSQSQGRAQEVAPVAKLAETDSADEEAAGQHLSTLKDAAEIIYPNAGRKLYLWWEEMNETYFGGQMTPPGIQFGLTPHGRSAGTWRGHEGTITLHRSLIDPAGDAWAEAERLGERRARDVLLHQMVHQYICEVRQITGREARKRSPQGGNGPEGGSPHNCPSWVAEINRIMKEMGLSYRACVIKQRRVDGEVRWAPPEEFPPEGFEGPDTIGEISEWPKPARPSGYYTSDPRPAFELKTRGEVEEQIQPQA